MRVLHVFADTNLFLQCKALTELDWSVLGTYDRIDVLITLPVIAEIDSLKGKGNDRRAARARSTSSQFRSIMVAQGMRIRVVEQPTVELCLRQDLRPFKPDPTGLNYDQRDDQLVGTMLGFCNADADAAAVLLTHDTGPAMNAQAVGLRFQFVPDDWLVPPESTDGSLKAELERYRKQEPRFVISMALDGSRGVEATLPHYEELTRADLLVLMSRLQARFPLCTDFGATGPQERPITNEMSGLLFTHATEVYRPASDEAIDKYKKAYAAWKEDCSKALQGVNWAIHVTREWPRLQLSIDNTGSRPATDALVVFEVQGAPEVFLLPPPKRKERGADDDEQDDDDAKDDGHLLGLARKLLKLPLPPQPPKGSWSLSDDAFALLSRSISGLSTREERILGPLMPRTSAFLPQARDPNEVYFKEGARGKISRRIEYSCKQWRHAQGAHDFDFLLMCKPIVGTHEGAVRVEVHAANLTQPQVATLPFMLSLTATSSFEAAKKLVEALGA